MSASGTPLINEVKLRLRPSLDQARTLFNTPLCGTSARVPRGGSQSLRDSRRAPILKSSDEISSIRFEVETPKGSREGLGGPSGGPERALRQKKYIGKALGSKTRCPREVLEHLGRS